jgi:Ca2+-binding RTX toxin-like protein
MDAGSNQGPGDNMPTFDLTNGDDVFTDPPGFDTVNALDGNDVVTVEYEDLTDNTVNGGLGSDRLVLDLRNSQGVILAAPLPNPGQGGYDGQALGLGFIFASAIAFTSIEHFTIYGSALVDSITTAGGDDIVEGGADADQISTGAGKDRLDGGTGDDSLTGGAGRDTYVVDSLGDTLTELANEGRDLVLASLTWTLADHFEDLTLTGGADLDGTGNAGANAINGNGGANDLTGLDGNDVLKGHGGVDNLVGGNGADRIDGGSGADAMTGGANSDHYFVDDSGDVVTELAGEGNGDRVQSNVFSYTLPDHVEDLTLLGGATVGTGNGGNNILTGHGGGNILDGGGGNDILYGLGGADVLTGGADGDVLKGGDQNDNLDGGLGRDRLFGGAGADSFTFSVAAGSADRDRINDMDPFNDLIRLDTSVFTGISGGVLGADAFESGAAALDAEDRILYDSATGNLYYDADGTGGAAVALLFAVVTAGLPLTHDHFLGF